MARTKSGKKQILINRRNRIRNQSYVSLMRTVTKRLRAAVAAGEAPEVIEKLHRDARSVIGKLATKGIIHKNQVSRRISRLDKLCSRSSARE